MIAIKYLLFAAISTVTNILSQYIIFSFYSGQGEFILALIIGTGVGLITKYILDKKYIFYHQSINKKEDLQKFTIYSLMGLITTAIFWGTEISFNYFFDSEFAKYIGAVIGLSIGYTLKYFLDKKFVFKK